jgi:predicted nucleic acid-binding protein
MALLLDANILCRLARSDDPQHGETRQAIEHCLQRQEELLLIPQAYREFWVVATRPRERNGLGMTPNETAEQLKAFEQFTTFTADTPAVHENWRRLVIQHQVSGKDAHDAGYIAAMQTHSIQRILTFDTADFRRYEPHIVVRTPEQISSERDQGLEQ